MTDWALEYPVKGVTISTSVYHADEYTVQAIAAIQRRCGFDVRVRPAGPCDLEERHVIVIPSDCKDWLLVTGFEGESWPHVHRNTTLGEIIHLANSTVDGVCSVHFRPALPDEIAQHDAEMREAAIEDLRRDRRWTLIGTRVQAGLVLLLSCLAVMLPGRWMIAALVAASILALDLAWVGLRWLLQPDQPSSGQRVQGGTEDVRPMLPKRAKRSSK
jgi:hypothetical protein